MSVNHFQPGVPADSASRDASSFGRELSEVRALLNNSLVDLYPPLSSLALAHMRRVQPNLRAAIVLAVGVGASESDAKRGQRIALAAALEMQAIALSIHRLLLDAAGEDGSIDKSLLGSTILTGDYCFSRAAVLATHTDSPIVVAYFSQALRTISEGHLRRLLENETTLYDEDRELMEVGVRAVGQLVELTTQAQEIARAYIEAALAHRRKGKPLSILPMEQLGAAQQARWRGFVRWLSDEAGQSEPTE